MKQTKSIIHQHRTVTLAQLKRADGSKVAKGLDVPEELNARFAERVSAIKSDVGLNERGKADKINEVSREALAELQKWQEPLLKNLDANANLHINELRAAVKPAPSKDVGDKIEAALLRADIRRSVANLTHDEIEVLYRTCGNANIRQALEELPSIRKTEAGAVIVQQPISDKAKEDVLLEEGRRLLPEVAERLDDINEIKGVYNAVANSLRQEVEKAAPVTFEPPIKVVV